MIPPRERHGAANHGNLHKSCKSHGIICKYAIQVEIYVIFTFIVFWGHWAEFLPQDLWKSIGITAIFACRRKHLNFHKNHGNHVKLKISMQNIVFQQNHTGIHIFFVFSRIHIAGGLDIPKEILVFPHRGSPNAGNHWYFRKFN